MLLLAALRYCTIGIAKDEKKNKTKWYANIFGHLIDFFENIGAGLFLASV